jgi:GAF domain-containing protein
VAGEVDETTLLADVSASFVELQSLLAETSTFSGFLADLAGLAARGFSEKVSTSITLVRDGRPHTAASSDELAAMADELQYRQETGPCLAAFRSGTDVIVDDLKGEARFADYPRQAVALGLRSLVALPLTSSGDPVGAFNLYSGDPAVFTDGNLVRARMLGAAAAGAVEIARRLAEQTQLNVDLKAAMASRRIIDQALGITMARENCDADTAFGMLRRRSQTEHRKLREIAIDVVTTTGGGPPADAPAFVPGRPR